MTDTSGLTSASTPTPSTVCFDSKGSVVSPELGIDSKVMRCSPVQGGNFPAAGQNWSKDKGENIPHFSCKDHGQTGDNKCTSHAKNMVKDDWQSSSKPQSTESIGMLPAAISTELSRDKSFCSLIEMAKVYDVKVKVLNHPLAKDRENLVISPDDLGDDGKTIRLFFNQDSGTYEVWRGRKKKPIPADTLDNAFLMGYYGCEEAGIDKKLLMHLSAKCHHDRLKRLYHNIDVPLGYDFTSSAYQGLVGGKVIPTRNTDAISSLYRSFEISRNRYTTDSMQEQQVEDLKNKVDAYTQKLIKESCFPNAISAASASVASDNLQANQAPDVQKASDNESEVPENAYLSVNILLPQGDENTPSSPSVIGGQASSDTTDPDQTLRTEVIDQQQFEHLLKQGHLSDNVSYHVKGSLKIGNELAPLLSKIKKLNLRVDGNFTCEGCTDLKSFPEGISVGVNLNLQGSGLESLSGVEAYWLTLEDCTSLKSLSEIEIGNFGLDLRSCTALESLYGVEVVGDLHLEGCSGLKSLSWVQVQGDIFADSCKSLESLCEVRAGRGWSSWTNFTVTDCTSLKSLSGVESSGRLDLSGCTSLESLSGVRNVGGNLNVSGCTSLESLSGFSGWVDGDFNFTGCTGISSLPAWVALQGSLMNGKSRTIFLDNTGLSAEQIDEFVHNAVSSGHECVRVPNETRLMFPETKPTPLPEPQPGESAAHSNTSSRDRFGNFNEAFAHWQRLARRGATTSQPSLTSNQQEELRQYLGLLTGTPDYASPQIRPFLADRVMSVMPLLEHTSKDIKEASSYLVTSAISSCIDRVAVVLENLETLELQIAAQTQAIEGGDSTGLKELGRKIMNLELVERYAMEHATANEESLEMALELVIKLRKQGVPLPGKTQRMLYSGSFMKVNDQTLIDKLIDKYVSGAAKYIEDNSSEEKLEQFLSRWEPWQPYQRHQEIPPFDQLEQKMVDTIGECVLTADKTATMVEIDGMAANPMDYGALCRIYRESGNNPFLSDTRLDWSKVRRLVERKP